MHGKHASEVRPQPHTDELEASLHEEPALEGSLQQHIGLDASLHEKHASEDSPQQRIGLETRLIAVEAGACAVLVLEARLHEEHASEEHALEGSLQQHIGLDASLHEKHASEGSPQQRIGLEARLIAVEAGACAVMVLERIPVDDGARTGIAPVCALGGSLPEGRVMTQAKDGGGLDDFADERGPFFDARRGQDVDFWPRC